MIKNLLLVDDEVTYLLSLREGLLCFDPELNVIIAEDGRQAVELLSLHDIDLVVTDLRMHGMDGFDLLRYLKMYYPLVSVIVTSSSGRQEVEDKLSGFSIHSYFEKPLELGELAGRIFAALGESEIAGGKLVPG